MSYQTTKKLKAGGLSVEVYPNREILGRESAKYVAHEIRRVVTQKGEVRIVFAAAISQLDFFEALLNMENIPWEKIVAFHMDEYHTLSEDAPQRFGNFLMEHLFSHKKFKSVHLIGADIDEYERLLSESPIDIVCMGIGENGHLAFNDPPVADFNDPKILKEVKLDQVCRQQQVNDGQFKNLEEVPETAITLTMPALLNVDFLSVLVPGDSKAEAVYQTIYHPKSTEWPSTALRDHDNAKLFLDNDSAKTIMEKLS